MVDHPPSPTPFRVPEKGPLSDQAPPPSTTSLPATSHDVSGHIDRLESLLDSILATMTIHPGSFNLDHHPQ